MQPDKKLYVIVRKDLRCSLPSVQAGHVVAEFCLRDPLSKIWNNEYLIYLEVENKLKLEHWMFKFSKRNINYSFFKEPDLDNEVTAICALIMETAFLFLL